MLKYGKPYIETCKFHFSKELIGIGNDKIQHILVYEWLL